MSQWLVAVIGRPNVGKSTLFNRLMGSRKAIVHDAPGVTRDRHYGDAEWAGKQFTLIDTGGYVPESVSIIEKAVREQAEIAIEEADLILFVVDGTDGCLPADFDLAAVLRKAGKKVVLIVNKIDSTQRDSFAAEFYELGLGQPFPISALAGLRIGDLLDHITKDIVPSPREEADHRLKVAVLGRPNVGKSSFVNALLREKRNIVTDIPGTTRDPVDSTLKYYGEEIVLIDTAGLRRRSRIKESVEFYSTIRTIRSLERCDVAVILLDSREGLQHQDLHIVDLAMNRHRAAVLAVNKWDLIEKDDQTARAMEQALEDRLRIYKFLPIIFISALSGQRVQKTLELVKEVDVEQRKRVNTSELNSLVGRNIEAVPPRSRSGKEIRINYITQVKVKPPVFTFFCNEPSLIEEHYKRYLENCLRDHFTFKGVPIVLGFRKK
jgi:GTP-binding protein